MDLATLNNLLKYPMLGLLLLGTVPLVCQAEDAPVIRSVPGPEAKFDTLADELLSQTEPAPKTWQLKQATEPNTAPYELTTRSMPLLKLPPVAPYLPHNMPGAFSTPLMARSFRGVNPRNLPIAKRILDEKLGSASTIANTGDEAPLNTLATVEQSTNSKSLAEKPAESTAPVKKVDASPSLFAIPFIKVPGWLWGAMASVFVGLALLAMASTVWLVQRMWQQALLSRKATLLPNPVLVQDVSPILTVQLPSPPPIKSYASVPKTRRGIEVRKLLQPTPSNVNDVLSQWVAQVSMVRQA